MRIEAGIYRPKRSTINRLICLLGGLVGGLTYGAIFNSFPHADPVVAAILAVAIGAEAMIGGLILRDWLE